MRHRSDRNQTVIVDALRRCGWFVVVLSQGAGIDLLAARHGRLVAIEVKDGSLASSRRRLTPAESRLHRGFQSAHAPVVVLESVEQAVAL